jgi:hypothetical protein
MMPTPQERMEKIELAISALATQVFAWPAFNPADHPREGGKFAPKGTPAGAQTHKKGTPADTRQLKAAQQYLKDRVAATSQIRGQNAITAQDIEKKKAAEAAAKKAGKGKGKDAAKKAAEEKKFMESRAASDKAAADKAAQVKAAQDKAAAAAPKATAAAPDQAQAMLDKQAADNSAGTGTTAAQAADTAGPLDPQQASAIKDVVQSFADEAAKEKPVAQGGDPQGAALASKAAQWAAAAATQGGKILQKVQDERDKMAKVVDDKSKPDLMRKQAQRIMEAYEEVLKNVDY